MFLRTGTKPNPATRKKKLEELRGQIIIAKEDNSNKMRAFLKLSQYIDDYLLITRFVDQKVLNAIESTKDNSHMTLVLALSYSARWEILESSKKVNRLLSKNHGQFYLYPEWNYV